MTNLRKQIRDLPSKDPTTLNGAELIELQEPGGGVGSSKYTTIGGAITKLAGSTVITELVSYTETATSGMQCRRLNATAGNILVTLPTAVGNKAIFRFKRPIEDVSGNTVTVIAFGGELIDGASTATFAAPDSADLISNGINWDVY